MPPLYPATSWHARAGGKAPVRAKGPGSPGGESASAAHSLWLAGLRKTYGGVVAVGGVSLEVPRGEFLTLLGPSGSGKTTLLMMVAGFVGPRSGAGRGGGRPVPAPPPGRPH